MLFQQVMSPSFRKDYSLYCYMILFKKLRLFPPL